MITERAFIAWSLYLTAAWGLTAWLAYRNGRAVGRLEILKEKLTRDDEGRP